MKARRTAYFLRLSRGFSAKSSQPSTINPMTTPMMANQVPILSMSCSHTPVKAVQKGAHLTRPALARRDALFPKQGRSARPTLRA